MTDSLEFNSIIDLVAALKENGIPEIEYPQRISKFLTLKSRKLRIPLIGTFELTPICNLNCKMCYVHLEEKKFSPNDLLPVDKWINIIDHAYSCGMRTATLTGGECLTYPGFDEIYLHLYSLGVKINIFTNGLLLNKNWISFFEQYPPSIIRISLYGSDDNEYEAVTGARVFQQVYNNLTLLKDTSIPVRIGITPNRFMNRNIRPMIEKIEALGFPYSFSGFLIPARPNTDRSVVMADIDDYVAWIKSINNKKPSDLVPIDITTLPSPNKEGKIVYGLRCGGGRNSFAIRYDGKMCVCVSLTDYSADLQNGFSAAWKNIVEYADHYQLPQECNGCYYESVCFVCPISHKNAPKGHRDPAVCMKTLRFISAGLLTAPLKCVEELE